MQNPKLGNLILVSRPIDFLYSIEICNKHKEKNFTVLIYPNSNALEIRAIEYLEAEFSSLFKNAEFKHFPNLFSKDILNLILFKLYITLHLSKKKLDLLATSGGVKGRLLYKYISFRHIIITDEGRGSLIRFPKVFESNKVFPEPEKKAFKTIYKLLAIDDLKNGDNFSVWTMYEELEALDAKVYLNKFKFLKGYIDTSSYAINENEVIILGSNPNGYKIDEAGYKELLYETREEYKGFNILLKPHKTFDKTYSFKRLNSDFPIEYYLMKRKKLPKYIVAFNSTSNKLMQYLFPTVILRNIDIS